MTRATRSSLVAVDVGNSRIKLGDFALPGDQPLPLPRETATFSLDWSDRDLADRLPAGAIECAWAIASVNRPAADRLVAWLRQRGVQDVRLLSQRDMPIVVNVARPETVGLDRLADAVAANRLRPPDRSAIVVDHGSAITVDLVSAQGEFRGGAILPGVNMSARALHEFTDRLPLVEVVDAPEVLERSTTGAIHFGLYWGAVGAVRELIARLSDAGVPPQVYLTGGGAPTLAAILAEGSVPPPQFVPHLTLAGVALAAAQAANRAEP